jgi:hypothetical protein
LKDENQGMVGKRKRKKKKEGGYRRHVWTKRVYDVQYGPRDERTDLGMCSTAQWTMVLTLLCRFVRGTILSTVLYCPVDNRTNCGMERPKRLAASMDMLQHQHGVSRAGRLSANVHHRHSVGRAGRLIANVSVSCSTVCRLYSAGEHMIELVLVNMVSVRLSACASLSQQWSPCG